MPDNGDTEELFGSLFARGAAAATITDRAWLAAMLEAEAALARAQASLGVIPQQAATAITSTCARLHLDPAEIGERATAGGNPVIAVVDEVRAALNTGGDGETARLVHFGATSQDIMDTATMLIARRACAALLGDLDVVTERLAELAATHRDTPMAGRTLLQQALPTTFGVLAASWLSALDTAGRRLAEVARHRLAAQLGGAVGTLAALGDRGPEVVPVYAEELGLGEPDLPWHTDRGRIAELAAALGGLAGQVAKPAQDITLLAQTEVGEVTEVGEGATGGSSTLPHKRNPVAAVSAVGCAQPTPGLVASLLAAMPQEYQRAAGAWHAEWLTLRDLVRRTGSAVAWLATSLERLRVDSDRMRTNLDRLGGALLAERLTTDLVGELDRQEAHELVRQACATAAATDSAELTEVLHSRLEGRRTRTQLAHLLDPAGYVGSAGVFVDRVLSTHTTTDTRVSRGVDPWQP